jgi:hypothetical protein
VAFLRKVLREEYEVDPEACLKDLVALLKELEAAGLIEVRDGPAS